MVEAVTVGPGQFAAPEVLCSQDFDL